jgi:transcriptional regulator of arginine metabolism
VLWRETLRELLTTTPIRTQEEAVEALASRGHDVNQATVSRELRRMGVSKIQGVYRVPTRPELGAPIHGFLTTSPGCLIVIRTDPAFAAVIAEAIDQADLEGVLGTLAGEDTVFVATANKASTKRLREFLGLGRSGKRDEEDGPKAKKPMARLPIRSRDVD